MPMTVRSTAFTSQKYEAQVRLLRSQCGCRSGGNSAEFKMTPEHVRPPAATLLQASGFGNGAPLDKHARIHSMPTCSTHRLRKDLRQRRGASAVQCWLVVLHAPPCLRDCNAQSRAHTALAVCAASMDSIRQSKRPGLSAGNQAACITPQQSGMYTVTRSPPLGPSCRLMLPPCRSTADRAIDRPRPLPDWGWSAIR